MRGRVRAYTLHCHSIYDNGFLKSQTVCSDKTIWRGYGIVHNEAPESIKIRIVCEASRDDANVYTEHNILYIGFLIVARTRRSFIALYTNRPWVQTVFLNSIEFYRSRFSIFILYTYSLKILNSFIRVVLINYIYNIPKIIRPHSCLSLWTVDHFSSEFYRLYR